MVGFDPVAEGGTVASAGCRRATQVALFACVVLAACSTTDAGTAAPTDSGASSHVPVEQVAEHQTCIADDDCHVVWTNCTCYAVRTDVSALADSRVCATNTCLYPPPTGAGCNGGRCRLFFDPNCAADTDCMIVWSRCLANAVNVDAAGPCACTVVHTGTTKTNALVSPDGECLKNNAVWQTARAVCDTQSARCMFGL
jgi:hypothetical protein